MGEVECHDSWSIHLYYYYYYYELYQQQLNDEPI